MKSTKKILACALSAVLLTGALTSCGGDSSSGSSDSTTAAAGGSAMSGAISVLTREAGSGTRGAFEELFEVEDQTVATAEETNSTGVMMTTVQGNKQAIGYISLGSLDESMVKAISIDGVAPTVENIENGTYKVSRPFNIATKEGLSEVAQDFVNYIMSDDGQAIVEEEGYIPQDTNGAYTGNKPSGTVTVAGSSSVTPLMEKLKEAYAKVNPNATIEINQSDSTTGMTSTIEGVCDIGMASRELKEEELSAGLTATVIATDGIAVIVNKDNSIDNLTTAQVQSIYKGETTDWSALAE